MANIETCTATEYCNRLHKELSVLCTSDSLQLSLEVCVAIIKFTGWRAGTAGIRPRPIKQKMVSYSSFLLVIPLWNWVVLLELFIWSLIFFSLLALPLFSFSTFHGRRLCLCVSFIMTPSGLSGIVSEGGFLPHGQCFLKNFNIPKKNLLYRNSGYSVLASHHFLPVINF